jgi:hypothetical protein
MKLQLINLMKVINLKISIKKMSKKIIKCILINLFQDNISKLNNQNHCIKKISQNQDMVHQKDLGQVQDLVQAQNIQVLEDQDQEV